VLKNAATEPHSGAIIDERENRTMSIANVITEIDAEITRLQQVRTILSEGAAPTPVSGLPAAAPKKRGRPAKAAAVVKTAAKPEEAAAAEPVKKKRSLSPEGRARIAAGVKARWAKTNAAAK